jgi:hypothetical protein
VQPCPPDVDFDYCDPDQLAARHYRALAQIEAARDLAMATAAVAGRTLTPAPIGKIGADHWTLTTWGLRYLELTRDRGATAIGGAQFPSSASGGQSRQGNSTYRPY